MTQLKKSEGDMVDELAKLQSSLATAQQELEHAQAQLAAAIKDKEAAQAYLLEIKPGCDYITKNIDTRNANRVTEKKALENAQAALRNSPIYLKAMDDLELESFGECRPKCEGGLNVEAAPCKACLAKVTVPAFCASYPGTPGC